MYPRSFAKRIVFDMFRASYFGIIARHAIIAKYKTQVLVSNYRAFALLVQERTSACTDVLMREALLANAERFVQAVVDALPIELP